ncbi:Transmembrane protein [Phytophthora megakarya]|uniref:Transmembrane protein n=1 Tax=Phytophthora megakarya TaxID=4795 RepID=A0A225V1M8_9STRA|nr:Transmembrane protein [Phytophthora megakarya]
MDNVDTDGFIRIRDTIYLGRHQLGSEGSSDGLTRREFTPLTKEKLDCVKTEKLSGFTKTITSITIASPEHFGFFLYTNIYERTVRVAYDWETLIANVSLGMLLHSVADDFKGRSEWFTGGLGRVARSRSLNMLPFVLLSRRKVSIASFWTAGCYFEGEQNALSGSWFTIYSGLVELFFLLNIVTKITRCRMTDMFFTPTTPTHGCEFDTSIDIKLMLISLNLLALMFASYIPPVKQPDKDLKREAWDAHLFTFTETIPKRRANVKNWRSIAMLIAMSSIFDGIRRVGCYHEHGACITCGIIE